MSRKGIKIFDGRVIKGLAQIIFSALDKGVDFIKIHIK